MTLVWDQVGERRYETGVDKGVLYPVADDGAYDDGVAWNGLESVTETPTGADATKTYADNIPYLNLISQELLGGTIAAYTYPDEWAECDGSASPTPGVRVGQQRRRPFGMCYRTRVGNDVEGPDFGYKLHLLYGATASVSERAYTTINDTPEALTFSWPFTTIPVAFADEGNAGLKPTSMLTIDSTKEDLDNIAALEAILYGDDETEARLPSPDEVLALFAGTATEVNLSTPANQPTYNAGTHVVTIPTVTGVTWTKNGAPATPGAQAAMTVGQTSHIVAHPTSGHVLSGDTDWDYDY